MYEQHFGLTAAPFQLNPDPSFYYESRGHKNALAYLKFGAHQGEGFIVVTGEIGAGKTTLVHTLLEGLDRDRVVAAKVVSTQLEAGDLLRAIMTAFGVPPTAPTKAQLIATLEAFLTALAASGRRALLVVDEAQNLDRTAVEELRMLSNFQLGKHGLLQSFLIGQPELRALLQSKSMEQLRQRVIASCHLGPLDASETRAYVEHRLRKVGWSGRPAFEDAAYAELHRWTGGVPRRINRLCSRLLLGLYLSDSSDITASLVATTAKELSDEIGEHLEVVAAPAPPAEPVRVPEGGAKRDTAAALAAPEPVPAGAVLCLVDTPADEALAQAILAQWSSAGGTPAPLVVATGLPSALRPRFARDTRVLLSDDEALGAGGAAAALLRLDDLLRRVAPPAVLAIGSSETMLDAVRWARRAGQPVALVGAGRRRWWDSENDVLRLEMLERSAQLLYTESAATSRVLQRAGVSSADAPTVGNMVLDAVRQVLDRPAHPEGRDMLHRAGVTELRNYVLATRRFASQVRPEEIVQTTTLLEDAAEHGPVLWLVDAATRREVKSSGRLPKLAQRRVYLVDGQTYDDAVQLLAHARAVIGCEQRVLLDESMAAGLPTFLVRASGLHALRNSEASPPVIAPADFSAALEAELGIARRLPLERGSKPREGSASERIARHLAGWLNSLPGAKPAGQEIRTRPA